MCLSLLADTLTIIKIFAMKRLQTVFSIQTSMRGRTVSRSSTNRLSGGTARTDAVGTIPSTDELNRVDYCGNVVYDRGERRLLLENGYVTFDIATNAPSYHFYLRDHLGNNRVVMAGDGTVEQVTHYYPFGGVMRESTNPGLQPYKYGGKELDRTSGLDAYDFGARTYFADRMQWGKMDPLCEKYYDWSPYGYCGNNPVNYSDHKGGFRTDFLDGLRGSHKYVNDGINQVVEVSHDTYQLLDVSGFNPNSNIYINAISNGNKRDDLFYTVENVLWNVSYVPYRGNCFTSAVKQNELLDTYIQGPDNRIDILDENACVMEENFIEGVGYIIEQLSSGNPLVVGVSTGVRHNNNNPNTGHFINIVGMGFDKKGNYFSYYDNAPSDVSKGTNLNENRMHFGMMNGTGGQILYDSSNPGGRIDLQYILSEIRRNK